MHTKILTSHGLYTCCLALIVFAMSSSHSAADDQSFLGKSVNRWARELASKDAKARRNAAFALGKYGPQATAAVPALIKTLKDSDAAVREAAASALGEIGPSDHEETIPNLVEVLANDSSTGVRRSAAIALGTLGKSASAPEDDLTRPVRAALEKALGDREALVRQNACWALGRIGPGKTKGSVRNLCDALEDSDALVRRDAAAALGEYGASARSAVPILVSRFKQEKVTAVRKNIVHSLVDLVGPENRGVIADLQTTLRDADPEMARDAAVAIAGAGGPEAAVAVPVLCKALEEDREASVRRQAAAALSRIGPDAVGSVTSLVRALSDRDPFVRRNSALALGQIGPRAAAAVDALAAIVESKEPEEIRMYAAEALAQISPAVEPAIPVLLRALKSDGNWRVRQRAIWALARLDNPEKAGLVPALTSILAETEVDTRLVRYDSAIVLGIFLGPKASEQVIDVLEALLKDKEVQVYTGSDPRVGAGGGETRGDDTGVTQNIAGDSRSLAAKALARIGPKANRPEIIKILKEAATSPDARVQEAASEALRKIQGAKK